MIDRDFDFLKERIRLDRGFNCNAYKELTLKRRIKVRMRATCKTNYREYSDFLFGNNAEYEQLLDVLTINVTEFFRDPGAWRALAEKVLLAIVQEKEKTKGKMIRIWSAGCASGEETYSLAILLDEALGGTHNLLVSIAATDIDAESLKKAKAGVYGKGQLKNVGRQRLEKYFNQEGKKFRVKPGIRRTVNFLRHDLVSGKEIVCFDLIVCRNTFIYFHKGAQEGILGRFHSALNRNGYLVIGKTETIPINAKQKFRLIDLGERIYRKK